HRERRGDRRLDRAVRRSTLRRRRDSDDEAAGAHAVKTVFSGAWDDADRDPQSIRHRLYTGSGSSLRRRLVAIWIKTNAMNGEKSMPPKNGMARRIGPRIGSLTFQTKSPRRNGNFSFGAQGRPTGRKMPTDSAPQSR